MNKAPSHLSYCDSRSADLARVRLALPQTGSEVAWPCRNPGNATGADLNGSPWAFLSLTVRQVPRHCILLQSP
jgi:hypothetical protein